MSDDFYNTGSISGNIITFGKGDGDFVGISNHSTGDISGNKITFCGGGGDHVEVGIISPYQPILSSNDNIINNKITFGDGAGDYVQADSLNIGNISGNKITFGDGVGDYVAVLNPSGGNISGNVITFGNGDGDYVLGGGSSNNKITFGNGNSDSVTLGSGAGGDYIATGTGSGDTVTVGAHTSADTFAFALGTNGTYFTTVSGAQGSPSGDHVVVNGGRLGNTLVSEGTLSPGTTLGSFISSVVVTPTPGDTYVGNNGTDTFIYTDTQTGHTGAIELVGVFNASIANHVLTLA